MSLTIKRLLPIVLVPVALLAGVGMIALHTSEAKGAVVVTEAIADAPHVPANRPELAIYATRSEGESRTKVFVRGHAGEAPKLVYVDPEPGELVDVSADGTHGVFRRYTSLGKTVDVPVDFRKLEACGGKA